MTGQSEPLTRRLQNVLKDYSLEFTFKEFLQNADDAGASVFELVVDWREHGCESLLTEGWKSWQGPAIHFYNDTKFTVRDWDAIVKLGQGGKRGDESEKSDVMAWESFRSSISTTADGS